MSRERVIVSIGEALLNERGGRSGIGGLAMAYAAAAVRAGKRHATADSEGVGGAGGWVVSRIGQDSTGDELLRQAREIGLNVDHVQSDPDLPTARMITRSIAGRVSSSLSPNAAFDNLQWDFDMIDLAQRADAVVFGQLARRGGQTKSVIKQFLLECSGGGGGGGVGGGGGGNALRVFDLTNRVSDKLDRGDTVSALEFCDVLVSDDIGLKTLAPTFGQTTALATTSATASTNGEVVDAALASAREVLRTSGVQVVIIIARQGESERVRAIARDQSAEAGEGGEAIALAQHEDAIMRIILGLLDGNDLATCVREASRSA